MRTDLVHLLRNLRRSPASALAAILTLSLTLGAGASIFAVVDRVLLTPPSFEDPDALVILAEAPLGAAGAATRRPSYRTLEAWRARAGGLATLEGFEGTNLTLTDLGAARRVSVSEVTPGFLPMLGIAPALGRGFGSEDLGRQVAVLSDGFWRGTLAADPNVVGRRIMLGNQPHTIVGVLPERFLFELNPTDIWRPLPVAPAQAADGLRLVVIGRLASGASGAALAEVLTDVSRTSTPPAQVSSTAVVDAISRGAMRTLGLLAGAVGLATIIAFANFAGLLIVRSIDRRRELAIRSALGARRFEIVRQLMLEAQALVALGAAGGVLLAAWMTPIVAKLALQQSGGVAHREVAMSWPVVAWVAIAASVCAALCALLPARAAGRRDVLAALRRGIAPRAELRSRRVLVVGEVALAFVLLACMTLFGQSLFRLLAIDPGFDPHRVVALQVSLPRATYADEATASLYATLLRALEGRLGTGSVGLASELPLTGDGGRSLVGRTQADANRDAVLREADPAYFEVMRIPLVSGRMFDPQTSRDAPLAVVISQSLASSLFAGEHAVGRRIWVRSRNRMADVLGVVGDVKHRALDEAALPTVYLSTSQSPSNSSIVVVRSDRPQADVVSTVRDEVARLDPRVPVYNVRSLEDVVAASPGVPARRVLIAAFSGFAALAVVLGAIGLFGVIAHDVASRRAELALRVALGADSTRIVRGVLRQGAVMVGSGVVAGAVLSIWAARVLSGMGFAADRLDPLSVGVATAMLVATGVVAVLPAARRALRIDPLSALRNE